ncbi:hypothetical protein DB35_04685 [Streptomyces abyssalis]|uniref:Uncharacterized protein n=1 Tax=Streptomyces abyssalis TaxID=933944 RepID=A0A1E7JQH8_9ACTN|nr:hypothetical protein [Streptomyces abyssalis]OEU90494.1 hypothetical protein AN215_13760 [Streptomyces abyssalis]OEU95231.1 hypothetical protein DB35_04670 [Streptomyces abyssalis]OEU95233.1 hypothetical protein DB35_04685 [Streptomyces abyssalis]
MTDRGNAARAAGNAALAVALLTLVLDTLTTGAHDWVTPAVLALAVVGTGLRIEAAILDRR